MSLSSSQLDAFVAIAKELQFSKAAEKLFVTQSALSQRIKSLEDELELALFIRNPTGLTLTEAGEKLLRYCQIKDQLEEEYIFQTKGPGGDRLGGVLRVAGFSSVMRSVIIPALSPLLREHPTIKWDFMIREMSELPAMLERAEADFIITDYKLDRAHLSGHLLGQEKYVVIESKKYKGPPDLYLDHNQGDLATEAFFKAQKLKNKQKYRRAYMGDVYGILDGVAQGLGRAVMSEHLIKENKNVRIVRGFDGLGFDVFLTHHHQPFYPKIYEAILTQLKSYCPKFLG
jgi:DNA-binding transcriptional LysR family regulator